MIFNFMNDHASKYPVEMMAKILCVSKAGYYKHANKKEPEIKQENRKLLAKIKEIFKRKRNVYGSPRICIELKKEGEKCSRKRVAKIMQANGIKAKTRKKWKATAKGSKDLSRIAPNLLEQNFYVDEANKAWVTDITYVSTKEGWLYVSTVLDLYSRKIVGLAMSAHANTDLVLNSVRQAITHRCPPKGLILHSDRGSQYTSDAYIDNVKACGFSRSMSGKGNCYDNAVMESFFHTLKAEHVFFENYLTRKEASASIFEYVEVFYNRQRSHSSLNYLSPVEFEAHQSDHLPKWMSSKMKLARPAIEVNNSRIHSV